MALLLALAVPAFAVEPSEMLKDPVLEQRARALSKGLRCLVCQNESIDESHADLAGELRVLLRERLSKGDSDDEAIDFLVSRYGEYVLLRPTVTGSNLLLWAAGPLMLIVALLMAAFYLRGRSSAPEPRINALNAEEERRLAELMGESNKEG